jgi:hypothetical protein
MKMADEKNDSKILVPARREVTIDGKKYEVHPFSIKEVIHFTRDIAGAFAKLQEKYPGLEISPDKAFEFLPILLDEAPRLIHLMAMSINKDGDWLSEQKDLSGASELFLAITELNDFGRIVSNFQLGWSKLKNQTIKASAKQQT